MAARYDVKVPVKSKDGQIRFWRGIGRVVQQGDKFSLYLDVVPVGWDGYAALMTPEPKQPSARPERDSAPERESAPTDEAPF